MIQVRQDQVVAKVKKEGKWEGYIVPSNCYPRPDHPFDLSMKIEVTEDMLTTEWIDNNTPFEKLLNSFMYYNCNIETGKRVHFYEEDTDGDDTQRSPRGNQGFEINL